MEMHGEAGSGVIRMHRDLAGWLMRCADHERTD